MEMKSAIEVKNGISQNESSHRQTVVYLYFAQKKSDQITWSLLES